MKRRATLIVITALLAATVAAQEEPTSDASGYIRTNRMDTYDTGHRLANGQWSIGSRVDLSYFNSFGRLVETDWRAWHFITNRATGDYINTFSDNFRSYEFVNTLTGVADYSSCYQGRAVAVAGGAATEIGGNHVCTDPAPPTGGSGGGCTGETCTANQQTSGCEFTAEGCPWWYQCPLIVNATGGPWRLSGANDPVTFDLDADGALDRLAWPATGAGLSFVVLDVNGNGTIDDGAELFGVGTRMPDGTRARNGFAALAVHDQNADGRIDSDDAVWSRLNLWQDDNRDGVSQASELQPLTFYRVTALGLEHRWSGRRDVNGNAFRYQSTVYSGTAQRPYYDVYLRVAQ